MEKRRGSSDSESYQRKHSAVNRSQRPLWQVSLVFHQQLFSILSFELQSMCALAVKGYRYTKGQLVRDFYYGVRVSLKTLSFAYPLKEVKFVRSGD